MRGGLLCAVLLPAAWEQAPVAWTPEFSFQFKGVGAVIPSPDGSRVAWTQTESVIEPERSETVTQIFLASAMQGRTFADAPAVAAAYPSDPTRSPMVAPCSRDTAAAMPRAMVQAAHGPS